VQLRPEFGRGSVVVVSQLLPLAAPGRAPAPRRAAAPARARPKAAGAVNMARLLQRHRAGNWLGTGAPITNSDLARQKHRSGNVHHLGWPELHLDAAHRGQDRLMCPPQPPHQRDQKRPREEEGGEKSKEEKKKRRKKTNPPPPPPPRGKNPRKGAPQNTPPNTPPPPPPPQTHRKQHRGRKKNPPPPTNKTQSCRSLYVPARVARSFARGTRGPRQLWVFRVKVLAGGGMPVRVVNRSCRLGGAPVPARSTVRLYRTWGMQHRNPMGS